MAATFKYGNSRHSPTCNREMLLTQEKSTNNWKTFRTTSGTLSSPAPLEIFSLLILVSSQKSALEIGARDSQLSLQQAVETRRDTRSRVSHFLDNLLTDGGLLSVLRSGYPLFPGRFLLLISIRGWINPMAIVQQEISGKLKSEMTLCKIQPTTFQLVA
jgi:hypothetical protein